MSKVFDFIVDNWELISCLLIGSINLIVLIAKKKVKIVDSVGTIISKNLPGIICKAEEVFTDEKSGEDKLNFVLNVCYQMISSLTDLTVEQVELKYKDKIVTDVEDILSTPMKK